MGSIFYLLRCSFELSWKKLKYQSMQTGKREKVIVDDKRLSELNSVHSYGGQLTLILKGSYACSSQIYSKGDLHESDEA